MDDVSFLGFPWKMACKDAHMGRGNSNGESKQVINSKSGTHPSLFTISLNEISFECAMRIFCVWLPAYPKG